MTTRRTRDAGVTHPGDADDALRHVVDATLARLEASGVVAIVGARPDVVATLCAALAASGLVHGATEAAPPRDAATLAAFLERAADADADEWRRHTSAPYASADLDEARRQAALTHMRLQQGGITREQAAGYFTSLARRVREHELQRPGEAP